MMSAALQPGSLAIARCPALSSSLDSSLGSSLDSILVFTLGPALGPALSPTFSPILDFTLSSAPGFPLGLSCAFSLDGLIKGRISRH